MDNQTTQNQNTWTVNGRRYFGRSKTDIPTEITINGESVHVKVKFKTKTDFETRRVNGTMEMNPVIKDVDTEVYNFNISSVRNVEIAKKFLWYPIDYVMLVISLIAAFFTQGIFLIAAAFYVFFLVRCRHMVISLHSGEEVRIPISAQLTSDEDLRAIRERLLHCGTSQSKPAGKQTPIIPTSMARQNVEQSVSIQPEASPAQTAEARPQTPGSKFCVSCGQKMQVEWACCPVCGTKAPAFQKTFNDSSLTPAENVSSTVQTPAAMAPPQPSAAVSQNKRPTQLTNGEYELVGRSGRLIGPFIRFLTKITVKDNEISVNTRKENADALVNWERFSMKDITRIETKRRFCWNILELCLFPVLLAALVMAAGYLLFKGMFSWPLTLATTAVAAGIWEVYMLLLSKAAKLVIFLNNGNTVQIPVDTKADTRLFLDGIGYPHNLPAASHSPFSNNMWQSQQHRMAIIGAVGALLLCFAGVYGIHLLDGLLIIQNWEIGSLIDDEDDGVPIQNFVERYCGSDGHWSAERVTIEQDGYFEKGDVCIEVTYSISDKDAGDTELRFMLGDYDGKKVIFDVSYMKLFGIECNESDEIHDMFFHMRDMYNMR